MEIVLGVFNIGVAGANHMLDGIYYRCKSSAPTRIGNSLYVRVNFG